MTEHAPSQAEWKALYTAAAAFKKQKPWEWMDDVDIFAIEDPQTGVVYYCSIMGGGGRLYGLTAYKGERGLEILLRLLEGDAGEDFIYEQDCLQCTFENREELEKEDLQVMRELNLSFRGRNQWPMFRDLSPGFVPWFLLPEQCRALTTILEQTVQVAEACRFSKMPLQGKGAAFLVRSFCEDARGHKRWKEQHRVPVFSPREFVGFTVGDELLVKKVRKFKPDTRVNYEISVFFSPNPVMEGERPYYPRICVIVDGNSGAVLAMELLPNVEQEGYVFVQRLLDLLIEHKKKPSAIYVDNMETYRLMEGFCQQMGLSLQQIRHLQFTSQLRHSLLEMMERLD